jgi:hypothetical protein
MTMAKFLVNEIMKMERRHESGNSMIEIENYKKVEDMKMERRYESG